MNGIVTEMKKVRSITTLASYDGACSKSTNEEIRDSVAATPEWNGKVLSTKIDADVLVDGNSRCKVVLFSTFGEK